MSRKTSAVELLEQGTGLLTSSHLRELGLTRSAIGAVWRAVDVVILPGYSRPMVRAEDYLELIADARSGRMSSLLLATWLTRIRGCVAPAERLGH